MFSRATGAPRSLYLLCAIALLLAAPARSGAQAVGTEAGTVRTASTSAPDTEVTQLNLLVGRSAIVNIGQPIARISLTRPEIADAMVTGSQQILVHGKAPGTISMFIWDRSGSIKRYDVTVARDLTQLNQQLRQLFPGESISVTGNGKDVVVSGTVSSKYVIEKAVDVAAGYVDKKEDVVNLLRQQEGVATNQVLLRVRFAEVSRTALTELGASFFTSPLGYKDYVARTTTQQYSAPTLDDKGSDATKLVFSDYLNLFLFNNKEGLGTLIKALQTKGLFESLAEPNLVAENGKEASFLAGGEYPYPVVQGTGANVAVTIVFKEYGIRLNFLPTLVGGDLIHLKVRPEVSSLDFTNAVTYQGFRIPSLSTRRAETEIELQDGQTFAIAGLLNNTVTSTMQKIPGIGDIPILGLLFRSKAAQKGQSELVVMITPQILRRGSMGAATGLPNLVEPYLPPPKKTLPQPPARLPGGAPQLGDTMPAPAPVAATPAVAAPASPIAAPSVSPARPAPAAPAAVVGQPAPAPTTAAPQAPPSPSPSRLPIVAPSVSPAKPAPSAPASPAVSPAPPAPPSTPKIDEKKLAEERKAAARAAELKKAEEEKAEERAAKVLKQTQEADARELVRQQALDAKHREAEAKAAEERKKADARELVRQQALDAKHREAEANAAEERKKAEAAQAARRAEAQRQAEAKAAEEQRKAEIRLAEEQGKAERARLELARKQAEEALKQEEKAASERAKRDAGAAKQTAELQRKQVDAEKKRLKEIQDAVDRLNAAQAAYQAAVAKTKKGPGQQ
jgi:pilus assembly protein CpaC